MDVQKISKNVRMQKWIAFIEECSKSGLPVKTWCDRNNISEQSYYYWLKKIRTRAVQEVSQSSASFSLIPVQDIISTRSSEIISISKGDIHIEVPDTIDHITLMNMMKSLLC